MDSIRYAQRHDTDVVDLMMATGISFVWDGVTHALTDDNLHFWHENFMTWSKPGRRYTVEARTGGERIVFTADPENIKAVLASQFNDFGKGEQFNRDFHDFLGDGIFSTDGQKWHDSRQLIRPQFIKDRVSDLDTFERHVSVLLPLLGGQGNTVDVKDLFFRYGHPLALFFPCHVSVTLRFSTRLLTLLSFTLDAATDFLLGHSAGSLHDPKSEFAHAFAVIQRIQSLLARAGPFQILYRKKHFRQQIRVLNAFVEPYIDTALALTSDELEKRTKMEEGYTFLHAIAAYTRDRKILRDQIVAVLLAGRDTTACTLSWLFWELARNPSVVAALRREIEDTVGLNRAPTYSDLKNMKILQHTLNETLRLYPVVPFNIRVALRDTSLPVGGGTDGNDPVGMPKGTPIGYSAHYMQLTPEIYPDVGPDFPPPDVFAPQRWDNWTPKIWTYIPFNGGPRICVGQNFALMEMGYTVTRILQRFSRIEARGSDGVDGGLDEKGRMEDRSLRGGFEDVGGAKTKETKGRVWQRREKETPELVERFTTTRMRMISEIVLQPGHEVNVAFYE